MTTALPQPALPRCRRCQATGPLRLEASVTLWNERMQTPQQVNTYLCLDRRACSERVNEAGQRFKEPDLWANYRQSCRPRRYTPRRYWQDGKRLTFAIAQALFAQAGHRLEKGQPHFPAGLRSGYIIDGQWRYTSLLEAIKLIESKRGQPKKPACRPNRPID